MPLKPEDRAEYMREYRARRTAAAMNPVYETLTTDVPEFAALRIAELETEVARLKRELALRTPLGGSFGHPRPAPKPGH